MEEDNGEYKDAGHHGEGAGVVRVGRADEPLVLVVTERANGYLLGCGHTGQAHLEQSWIRHMDYYFDFDFIDYTLW